DKKSALLLWLAIDTYEVVIYMLTIGEDRKTLTEVSRTLREVALPKFRHSVDIKPAGPFSLHELPQNLPPTMPWKYVRHLHFRMDFHKPSWADCPHKAPYTKDDIWTEIKSDSDLDASDSETSRSDYHSHEGLPDHSRDFEHLAFTAGLIVNKISDNRLDTFRAWECINRSWGASTTTITDIEETDSTGASYGVEDWGSQLRKERVSGGVLSPSVYRLQEEFCDFIEWAFGYQGIHSLRTIA
ncbi:hypothetical protein CDV31_017069, partial [Fusarium ambrosium]